MRGEKAPTQIQARHQFWTSRKIGYAAQRIWIDEQAEPFPTVNCCCLSAMELDYSQGLQFMAQRLNTFLTAHEECLPEGNL